MNTSIIKKETTDQNIQPAVKISRRFTTIHGTRKNDLVIVLREENDLLYEEYCEVIKRNIELRAIVEKQQKLINAIYNAELNLVFPVDEKNIAEEIKTEPVHQVIAEEEKEESVSMFPVTMIPVSEPAVVQDEMPEIKLPQPLGINDLARRIFRLHRKQWQSQTSLVEKTKFILAIYNAPDGIHCNTLFSDCGITRVTGLRYVSFFRKFSMVSNGGTYRITDTGRKFVEGEPNPEWDKRIVKNWRKIDQNNL